MKRMIKLAILLFLPVTVCQAFGENATPAEVETKINRAAEMMKSEGVAKSFGKLRDRDGEFVFKGTYIWVHDYNGTVLLHPLEPEMEGKSIIGLQDNTGKKFVKMMNEIVQESEKGWVDYFWPKPGTTVAVRKASFVRGVEVDGKVYVLGSGVYDLPDSVIDTLIDD